MNNNANLPQVSHPQSGTDPRRAISFGAALGARLRRTLVAAAIGVASVCFSASNHAENATQCDVLVASPFDKTRPAGVAGVTFDNIDGARAVAACVAVAQDSNNPRVWFQLGRALDKLQRYADAFHWYSRAASAGHARAQYGLALMYDEGKGVARDDVQAVVWFRKAADQGDAAAQNSLGVMYHNAHDDAQAAVWFRKAADQGHAFAQYGLGAMYDEGRGVAHDAIQALAWYHKAAEQGNMQAQSNLGIMYAEGTQVARDDVQAVFWYRKAADQGFAHAQYNLGHMYDEGKGIARDDVQAAVWYRKAADQGNADAQNNLGVMYQRGTGVARNLSEAVAWYRKAADQGNINAQRNLRDLRDDENNDSSAPIIHQQTCHTVIDSYNPSGGSLTHQECD